MDWRDETAEGLPARRDDDPATLRRDIVDELADHLHSAVQRELTKNITPDEAVRNVRRRFGDPRAIARRLWFDALKGKMMLQRLTFGMVAIVACVSIAVAGFAWVAVRDSRAANAALLAKLAEMTPPRAETTADLERMRQISVWPIQLPESMIAETRLALAEKTRKGNDLPTLKHLMMELGTDSARDEPQGRAVLRRMGIDVTIQLDTAELAELSRARFPRGLKATFVRVGSPASKAEIQANDILVGLDHWSISTLHDVYWIAKYQHKDQSPWTPQVVLLRKKDAGFGVITTSLPPIPLR